MRDLPGELLLSDLDAWYGDTLAPALADLDLRSRPDPLIQQVRAATLASGLQV